MLQYCFQVCFMVYILIQFSNNSINASSVLPSFAQENGTTEVAEASDIFLGLSQENETTEVVDAPNILPGISEENITTEVAATSNILLGISQENETTEVVDAPNILQGISQENRTTVVVDAPNILPGISQENRTTEVVDPPNILTDILQENGLTEVAAASIILPGISQESETTVVVDAPNILPGISHLNETTGVIDASYFLRGTSQENDITEVVNASNLLSDQNFEPLPRSCYDLRKLGGVCKNKDNTIIESDAVSGVKEIYSLTFNDTKYLPARTLFGFSIQYLVLDDPDITVDGDVFDGIVHLYDFSVKKSNIKLLAVSTAVDSALKSLGQRKTNGNPIIADITASSLLQQVTPDFRIVKNTIQSIGIHSSPLTSLDGKNLQNLTMVKRLLFDKNAISFIEPDVFKGTESVLILDLSYNCLTSIPPNLLDPMQNLSTFLAQRNNLLHVDNLFSITHPQAIYLSSNNITDVESVLHFNMKNLKILHLSGNPIKNLTEDSFNGKINNVKLLSLRQCQLQKFSFEYFYKLKVLETLDLGDNLIQEDSDAYSESFKDFDDRTILFQLKRFNIIGNNIKSIRKILKYKEILEVIIAKNQIQYLTDEDFRFLHKTEHLELQENQIRQIDTDTFKHISASLSYLDMSYNSISSLNRSVRYLSQIRKLSITNNLIQFFATDEFASLNELSDLNLQHNRINALGEFQHLPNLKYLDIKHNDIKVMRADQVPKSLKFMYLAGNPLQCDCRLQPFLLRINSKDFIATDIHLCTQFVSKTSNCPVMCSCGCTNFGDDYFMSIDCSSKCLSVVPQFLRDGFTQMEDNATITSDGQSHFVMKQNIYSSFVLEDKVLGVNLENNSLESVEGLQLPPNLIQLYLAKNKLSRLPDSILENLVNLKNVSLSGNPWNCDCNSLKLKRWLTSLRHETIRDIENVTCGTSVKGESTLNGKVIWNLIDHDLCPKNVNFIVSASIGVLTVVILCLATINLFRKNELNIKVFLHSRGLTFIKDNDLDYDKVFDAFLSFCHQDDQFVIEEIISVIEERDPKIRLCIHNRHFMVGEYVHDNIIWAIQNSKRTVIILSKNFLDSEWCLMEFRTAHLQVLQDSVHRIIVIKVGDLPKEMDPEIKGYLDSTTYLTWGEKNFWNKLLYVLPSGSNVRNSVQEI